MIRVWTPALFPPEPQRPLASFLCMPRSNPSRADRELMRQATSAGYQVSAAQLERWRSKGLLPAPARIFLGRRGSEMVYPEGTAELVCTLAKHAGPGRKVEDLALLAFFDGAMVPEEALKTALAVAYFTRRFQSDRQVSDVIASVPDGWDQDLGIAYEAAEAEAKLDLAEGGRAIQQMRINLRRLPELAQAPRRILDERLLGVLVGLNLPRLPKEDVEFMSDLSAALALNSAQDGDDALAVWEYAAISHVAQMAVYEETSPEERLGLLVETSLEELYELRGQVRVAADQMWERATGGRQAQAPNTEPWLARAMASMLMEWMSARLVHPPGAVLAERYYPESLAHLELCCLWAAAAEPAREGQVGEGRARFIDRTTRRRE